MEHCYCGLSQVQLGHIWFEKSNQYYFRSLPTDPIAGHVYAAMHKTYLLLKNCENETAELRTLKIYNKGQLLDMYMQPCIKHTYCWRLGKTKLQGWEHWKRSMKGKEGAGLIKKRKYRVKPLVQQRTLGLVSSNENSSSRRELTAEIVFSFFFFLISALHSCPLVVPKLLLKAFLWETVALNSEALPFSSTRYLHDLQKWGNDWRKIAKHWFWRRQLEENGQNIDFRGECTDIPRSARPGGF